MLGETISHYRIIEKLGEGGMGVVYKAEDTKLHRTVALKFLRTQMLEGEEARIRFMHEARAAAALDHPNICTVYEVNESDDHTYIAMAFIEGESLQERLQTGPFALEEALEISVQVAEGLRAAHGNGIVHRDIKSANIMVTQERRVKVMDFGLAKTAGATRVTRTGMTLGTAAYMSPEQALGKVTDHRTDIWSLGVVLYEMLTGRLPFAGEYDATLMYSIVNEQPELVTALKPDIPLEVERVVNRSLAKDPKKRYQSAEDLIGDLQELRESLDLLPRRSRLHLRMIRQRRRIVVGAVTVAAVAVLAILGICLFSGGAKPIDSIAVLPLDNLSGDPSQEYFADGMTEELIATLSKIRAIKVISRTSVMQYKDTRKPLPEIARELGVGAIVGGSVLHAGDSVRITVQLVDGATDRHLWADRYDRAMRNVLAMHSEVARAIAREIEATLTPEEESRLMDTRIVDTEAYDTYLKGRYSLHQMTGEGVMKAIKYFEQVIESDPSHALAYSGLADAYILRAFGYSPMQAEEVFSRAEVAAQKALELDETLSEAYSSIATIRLLRWDWRGAERAFEQAIRLNPSNVNAHFWYSAYLLWHRRFDEFQAEIEKAYNLEPTPSTASTLGWPYAMTGQLEEAIGQYRKALAMDPDCELAHYNLGSTYIASGMYQEAIIELRKAVSLAGDDPSYTAMLGRAYAKAGRRDEAEKILDDLFARYGEDKDFSLFNLSWIYLGLGELEEALELLERAYLERDFWLPQINAEPMFDPIRDDPRFVKLLRKMGMVNAKETVVSADGVEIAFETYGDREPALVFIHGWCCDRSYWKEQLYHFSFKHKVVALDLAGHGESGIGRMDWSMQAFASDVVAVVEKLDPVQVILIGNSMGGSVMLEAALKMPERTIGLVSVDAIADPEKKYSIEAEVARYSEDFAKAIEQDIQNDILMPDSDSDLREKVFSDLAGCLPGVALPVMKRSFAYYNEGDLKKALRKIRVPIRAIHSRNQFNPEIFSPYTRLIDGVNMMEVGHVPMLEEPDRFNRLLEKMLDEIENASNPD